MIGFVVPVQRRWRVVLIAMVGLLSACGHQTIAARSAPAGPSRYSTRETHDHGKLIMDADPTNAPNRMSQAQALDASRKDAVFGSAINGHTPDVRYGLFTNSGSGTTDAAGKFTPLTERVPAWAVVYRQVPWAGVSGGPLSNQTPKSTQAAALRDLMIVIADDGNGTFLGAFAVEPS